MRKDQTYFEGLKIENKMSIILKGKMNDQIYKEMNHENTSISQDNSSPFQEMALALKNIKNSDNKKTYKILPNSFEKIRPQFPDIKTYKKELYSKAFCSIIKQIYTDMIQYYEVFISILRSNLDSKDMNNNYDKIFDNNGECEITTETIKNAMFSLFRKANEQFAKMYLLQEEPQASSNANVPQNNQTTPIQINDFPIHIIHDQSQVLKEKEFSSEQTISVEENANNYQFQNSQENQLFNNKDGNFINKEQPDFVYQNEYYQFENTQDHFFEKQNQSMHYKQKSSGFDNLKLSSTQQTNGWSSQTNTEYMSKNDFFSDSNIGNVPNEYILSSTNQQLTEQQQFEQVQNSQQDGNFINNQQADFMHQDQYNQFKNNQHHSYEKQNQNMQSESISIGLENLQQSSIQHTNGQSKQTNSQFEQNYTLLSDSKIENVSTQYTYNTQNEQIIDNQQLEQIQNFQNSNSQFLKEQANLFYLNSNGSQNEFEMNYNPELNARGMIEEQEEYGYQSADQQQNYEYIQYQKSNQIFHRNGNFASLRQQSQQEQNYQDFYSQQNSINQMME